MSRTDDELALFQEEDERKAEWRRAQGEDLVDPEDAAIHDRRVTPPTDADYALPEVLHRTAPAAELRLLRELLAELRAFREPLVGLTARHARILYNGDEQAMFLGEALADWTIAHCRRRLSRPSPRDGGDPLLKFFRLYLEASRWWEVLATRPGHSVVMSGLHRRRAWEFWQGTVGPLVDIAHVRGETLFRFRGLNPSRHSAAEDVIKAMDWDLIDLGRRRVADSPMIADGIVGDPTALVAERSSLARDLMEVRGLMLRGYRAEDHVVELPGGWLASWSWAIGHKVGLVRVVADRETLVECLGTARRAEGFELDVDGTPTEIGAPWTSLGPDALAWSLGVLRPLHARLVGAWLERARPTPPTEEPDDPITRGELVSASCEALAREDLAAEGERPLGRLHVPALRTLTLLGLLQRHFGCEVACGKGSEITVWRPGGHKFTLGRHKRNTHVPSHVVRALLQAVGIGAAEWARGALGRGA